MDEAAYKSWNMALIGPAVLLVFAAGFACVWVATPDRRYLLAFSLAILLYAAGACSQLLYWPPTLNANAVVSAALYTGAVLIACRALLTRTGSRLYWFFDAAVFTAIVGAISYYSYIKYDLFVRVYILNFGFGVILLITAAMLTPLLHQRAVDRVLFWVFALFALHFFPRTLLTYGRAAATATSGFGASPFWVTLQISLTFFATALALALLAQTMVDLVEDLRAQRDTDGLTGVRNRLGFELEATHLRKSAPKKQLSVIVCDLDHFKTINDRYGHAAGDEALRRFGLMLRQAVRAPDIVGRIGGEEFAVLAHNLGRDSAYRLAERLRSELAGALSLPGGEPLTASFGVAEWQAGEDLWASIARADEALYGAKVAGRNRTVRNAV